MVQKKRRSRPFYLIDDNEIRVVPSQCVNYDLHNVRRSQEPFDEKKGSAFRYKFFAADCIIKIFTNLHHLHPTAIEAAIDGFLHKRRGWAVLFMGAASILRCQSGRYGRGIASMSGNDLLVCFEAAVRGGALAYLPSAEWILQRQQPRAVRRPLTLRRNHERLL